MIKNRFFKTTLGFFAELAVVSKLDDSNTAAPQANLQAFVTSAANGSISLFWADDNTLVAAGATALAVNAKRSFFYAWKQADGSLKTSTPIPVAGLTYKSAAYNAGTAQVRTVTFGGTVSAKQILHVVISETTGTILPFPRYVYEVEVPAGGVNAAVTALAAQINAEKADNDPVVSATAATNVLTLTAKSKYRNFKVTAQLETVSAAPDDLSAITFAETAKQVYPIGDLETIKELERYAHEGQGGVTYVSSTVTKDEFNKFASNIDNTGATQYGILLVTSDRVEKGGVLNPALNHTARIVIAVRTADVATLADR